MAATTTAHTHQLLLHTPHALCLPLLLRLLRGRLVLLLLPDTPLKLCNGVRKAVCAKMSRAPEREGGLQGRGRRRRRRRTGDTTSYRRAGGRHLGGRDGTGVLLPCICYPACCSFKVASVSTHCASVSTHCASVCVLQEGRWGKMGRRGERPRLTQGGPLLLPLLLLLLLLGFGVQAVVVEMVVQGRERSERREGRPWVEHRHPHRHAPGAVRVVQPRVRVVRGRRGRCDLADPGGGRVRQRRGVHAKDVFDCSGRVCVCLSSLLRRGLLDFDRKLHREGIKNGPSLAGWPGRGGKSGRQCTCAIIKVVSWSQ
jgi:hypothetical protein